MEPILFYFFSGLAILSALCVILLPNMTRALLSLIVTMFSLTVLYLLLGAPFIAMANLIVYAGAVLVLFLFVIMLQGVGARDVPILNRFSRNYLFLVSFVGVLFALAFLSALFVQQGTFPEPFGVLGSMRAIGEKLFYDYLLPFELISVVLLVGIFAAVALAKKEDAS